MLFTNTIAISPDSYITVMHGCNKFCKVSNDFVFVRLPRAAYLTTVIKIMYLAVGIVTVPKYEKYALLYFIIYNCNACYASIGVGLTFANPTISSMETLFSFFATLCVWRALLMARYLRPLLLEFVQDCCQLVDKSVYFLTLSNQLILGSKKLCSMILISAIIQFNVPVYIFFFTDTEITDPGALMYPCWYPWSLEKMPVYILTMFHQCLSLLMAYTVVIFYIGFFVLWTLVIYVSYCEIMQELLQFESAALIRINNNESTVESRWLIHQFKRIIVHHQMVKK